MIQILTGDALKVLKTLEAQSIQTCVTSPPYFNLRHYGVEGQLGLEKTPAEYVEKLAWVFREVRRVLKDNGTLWLNLGDSYAHSVRTHETKSAKQSSVRGSVMDTPSRDFSGAGLKTKDLVGIPWRVAFALQTDGWYLRQDIIWCLSGGAWIYAKTQKGEMPIMVKDLVRLKPETVQLWNGQKWTRVLGWNLSGDPGTKIELVLRSGERIGCTPAHLWPTQRGNVRADSLQKGDVIQSCGLPEPVHASCPEYLTPDTLWFIGLYLAEGSRSGDTIQISGHAKESEWISRISGLACHYGGSSTYSIKGNILAIRVYSPILTAILDSYIGGVDAHDKHLKVKAWALPNSSLISLVEGYLEGDGHCDGDRIRLGFCRNYSLERDLRTLSARLGATLTLKPMIAINQSGKFAAFRGEWRWSRSGHFNQKHRGEIMEIRQSRARKFWDIGVEDEPHLFALASGVLTHNSKPNSMPESVTDRCTKSHEYIFLLSKSAKYYFNHEVIKEKTSGCKPAGNTKAMNPGLLSKEGWSLDPARSIPEYRNKRSVWTVATTPYPGAHFAAYPPDLIRPCILAGSKPGDRILDPFFGAGTTGLVALELGRDCIGIELNPDYVAMADKRLSEYQTPKLKKAQAIRRIREAEGQLVFSLV